MTPFPRTPFLSLVANLLGCPVPYVTWKGTPEPAYMIPTAPLKWASARVGASSRRPVGADDLRRKDNGDGTFTVNATGRRQITIGIDCFTWDSTLADIADELLEQLTTRIYQPNNLDTLNLMALVIETNSAIIPIPPVTINGRAISAAHVDLMMGLANQDAATYPGGNQWVSEVQGTGSVTPDGSTVAGQIPFDVKDR